MGLCDPPLAWQLLMEMVAAFPQGKQNAGRVEDVRARNCGCGPASWWWQLERTSAQFYFIFWMAQWETVRLRQRVSLYLFQCHLLKKLLFPPLIGLGILVRNQLTIVWFISGLNSILLNYISIFVQIPCYLNVLLLYSMFWNKKV